MDAHRFDQRQHQTDYHQLNLLEKNIVTKKLDQKEYWIFIPLRNLLRKGWDMASLMCTCVCLQLALKKKPLARIFIKLYTFIWHGKRTDPVTFKSMR